ncbi:DUF3305 domain-containing protein [Azospirillum sp. SYSU D00513]|uniref:DUF3305 domain-containing protein n=1 Tax=Azospirillum sp. SYSU D00513 TaxID=2812561 RepID=UPI001A96623F|nr:DUF3305 domain-containing protein [Azospirillum sp. SYSU D00513]
MDPTERMSVGVLVERRRIDSLWQPERWQAVTVLPDALPLPPWTILEEGDGWTRYYAGAVELELFRTETDNYKHNLESTRPSVYVILRRGGEGPGVTLLEATVDPGEIDAHSDAGDDLIDALPLPAPIAAWMRDFLARHHVERPFHKRQRDRADTEALGRRVPVSFPEDDDA